MKSKSYAFATWLALSAASGQTTSPQPNFPGAAEEAQADLFSQSGRQLDAFSHYMSAWQLTAQAYDRQKSRDLVRAMERIRLELFAAAHGLAAVPAAPEEAIQAAQRAETAIRSAQTARDFAPAVEEYRRAIRLAPWVPEYYRRRAYAQEMEGKYEDAVVYLKDYLKAAPEAADSIAVRAKIESLQRLVPPDRRSHAAESGTSAK